MYVFFINLFYIFHIVNAQTTLTTAWGEQNRELEVGRFLLIEFVVVFDLNLNLKFKIRKIVNKILNYN